MENRYEWLFRHSPVIAALTDADGRFTDVSDAWASRLGFSLEEVRGRTPEDIATPPSARQIREEHLPQFKRTGRLDHVPVDDVGDVDCRARRIRPLAAFAIIFQGALGS
jgi:PAS domain S-box-containing protein